MPTKKLTPEEEEFTDKIANVISDFVLFAINAPLHYILSGLTLSIIWDMLITPQFPVDSLTLNQCIAILIVFNFLRSRRRTEEEKKLSYLDRFIILVMWCGLILLVGYVASLFI